MTYNKMIDTILVIMKASGMRDRGWVLTDDSCAQMRLDEGDSYFFIQFEEYPMIDETSIRIAHIDKNIPNDILMECGSYYYEPEEFLALPLEIQLECVFESDTCYSSWYNTSLHDAVNRFRYFAWNQDEKYLYEEN